MAAKAGRQKVSTAAVAAKQAAVDKAVASRQKAFVTIAAFARVPSAVFTSFFAWVHVGRCSRGQQYLVHDNKPLLGDTVRSLTECSAEN